MTVLMFTRLFFLDLVPKTRIMRCMILSGHLMGHSCFVNQYFIIHKSRPHMGQFDSRIVAGFAMSQKSTGSQPWAPIQVPIRGVSHLIRGEIMSPVTLFLPRHFIPWTHRIRSNMHGLRACRPIQAPVVRHLLIALGFQKNSKVGLSKHGTSQRTELKFIDGLKMTLDSTNNT